MTTISCAVCFVCQLQLARITLFQVLVAILPQTPMQYFDVETKTWKPLPSMAQLTEATECCCAEYIDNYLYVAAKKGNDFVNYRYDTFSNSWEILPPILSHSDFCNRQIDSLCFLDDFLYAIGGGSTCVPFKYSLAKNNWQGGASLGFVKKHFDDPKSQLTNATTTVWKSHIYVLHGLKTAKEIPCLVTKAQAAPSTRSLGKVAAPPSTFPARGSFGVTTSGSLFGATGFGTSAPPPSAVPTGHFGASPGSPLIGTGFKTVSTPFAARTTGSDLGVGSGTSEVSTGSGNTFQFWADEAAVLHCFNPKTNKWKQQSTTCRPHHDSRLFVVNNKLYVTGGSGSSLYPSASVEVYDDENNIWSVVEQTHIPPNKLGAVEIEGRVYILVNKFPVDVGIRIPPGEVYQICLNDWENLAQIDEDAVLCYMPVKTESLNTD